MTGTIRSLFDMATVSKTAAVPHAGVDASVDVVVLDGDDEFDELDAMGTDGPDADWAPDPPPSPPISCSLHPLP